MHFPLNMSMKNKTCSCKVKVSSSWCDILCCKHALIPRNVTGKNRPISDRMCEWSVNIFIMLADPELFSSFGLLCS